MPQAFILQRLERNNSGKTPQYVSNAGRHEIMLKCGQMMLRRDLFKCVV